MTSERSVTSSSPSPSGGGRWGTTAATIPADFIPYVGAQDDDTLRCSDCKGYTPYASVIGIVGRYCSCPFDLEHQ